MKTEYVPGVCRNCGTCVNELPRCPVCGTRQPESGFRLKSEGTKPPINGFAMLSFVFGWFSWAIGVFGLIALCGFVFSIVGLVGIYRRGQSGTVFAVLGMVLCIGSFVIRTMFLFSLLYMLMFITEGLRY